MNDSVRIDHLIVAVYHNDMKWKETSEATG